MGEVWEDLRDKVGRLCRPGKPKASHEVPPGKLRFPETLLNYMLSMRISMISKVIV